MATIRILQGISGADFSWAPGDLVDLDEDQAAVWADGERAELVDDVEPRHEQTPSAVYQEPKVVGEDGQELEVLAATVEEIDPPDGAGDGPRQVRWSVTVRLPAPAAADVVDLFDPAEHSAKEVLAYLEGVGDVEAQRVLQAEENSATPRKGVLGQRDAILARARAHDQAAAEHAVEASRGGGRGDGIETR
ncbi:hypothetical protein [Streptomyces sp. NPDC002547]